jgi:acyl dehydratase
MTTTDTQGATSRTLEMVCLGEEIPPFGRPLTLQRLVMEAAANRDFTPLHHDRDDARATGAPDAYANTMFIQAIIEASLRQWMGPQGWLDQLNIRMESFNLVDTFVTAHGKVVDIEEGEHSGVVAFDVWMTADGKRTVSGNARVRLPRAPNGT